MDWIGGQAVTELPLVKIILWVQSRRSAVEVNFNNDLGGSLIRI